ncbi:MAG TPA: CBS domain-containing protein [Acidimicrobiales bacterium]|nr:CBS domain-containing protein [Acidimicrobiales bacterium]
MHISALLAAKGKAVATIAAGATVADAVAELERLGIGALVVSGDGAHMEGIVSERDVVRALGHQGGELLDRPVSSIMTTEVVTASPDDEVDWLMATMTDHRVRHVPVVVHGELQGLVSIGDVVKSRIGELEKDRKELVEYITAR